MCKIDKGNIIMRLLGCVIISLDSCSNFGSRDPWRRKLNFNLIAIITYQVLRWKKKKGTEMCINKKHTMNEKYNVDMNEYFVYKV